MTTTKTAPAGHASMHVERFTYPSGTRYVGVVCECGDTLGSAYEYGQRPSDIWHLALPRPDMTDEEIIYLVAGEAIEHRNYARELEASDRRRAWLLEQMASEQGTA